MLSRLVCSAVLVLGLGTATAADQPPESLGEKMVEFCKNNKGKTVSTGECSALANTALRTVGAKTRGKDSPNAPVVTEFPLGSTEPFALPDARS